MKLNPEHRMHQQCYVVAEALYHALGGKQSGLRPKQLSYEGISHWWLETSDGKVVDLTRGQFAEKFPYHLGRNVGFLTQKMSLRTKRFLGDSK